MHGQMDSNGVMAKHMWICHCRAMATVLGAKAHCFSNMSATFMMLPIESLYVLFTAEVFYFMKGFDVS